MYVLAHSLSRLLMRPGGLPPFRMDNPTPTDRVQQRRYLLGNRRLAGGRIHRDEVKRLIKDHPAYRPVFPGKLNISVY